MLRRIVSLLSGTGGATAPDAPGAGVDRITIAACVLLLEMAKADDFFSSSEQEKIREILRADLGLPPDEIDGVLAIAGREREDSADLWAYTNLINESFSDAEKSRLVEMIWEVAYADGSLDQHEDYIVHKLANLLHVKHRDLIAAKLRVKARAGNAPGAI